MKLEEMEKVLKFMKMEINMIVIFSMVKKTYMESWIIITRNNMKENGY